MDLLALLRAVFALALTLGLVAAAAWGFRRFGPDTLARLQGARRERRLKLVESLFLDPNRRLVLVRADGTDHLLLLGDGTMLASGPAAPEPPPPPPGEGSAIPPLTLQSLWRGLRR